jgi:hypothetical protein
MPKAIGLTSNDSFNRNLPVDPTSKTSIALAKALFVLFLFIIVAIFLIKPPLTSSTASVQAEQRERVFENTIPKDVPIRLKMNKEKEQAFKSLKNEKWAREFELEVLNTGDKPIYYLDILMVTDVKAADGHRIVFPLQYGRAPLGDIISKPGPDDVPIRPGETHIFKIHPGQVPAWELGQREEKRAQPTKMRLELQSLSFGDGTGYFGNQPYPQSKRQSSLDHLMQAAKTPIIPTVTFP